MKTAIAIGALALALGIVGCLLGADSPDRLMVQTNGVPVMAIRIARETNWTTVMIREVDADGGTRPVCREISYVVDTYYATVGTNRLFMWEGIENVPTSVRDHLCQRIEGLQ